MCLFSIEEKTAYPRMAKQAHLCMAYRMNAMSERERENKHGCSNTSVQNKTQSQELVRVTYAHMHKTLHEGERSVCEKCNRVKTLLLLAEMNKVKTLFFVGRDAIE